MLATETERWPFSAGQPGWVELPSTLALFSLITALLGMYSDISLHIADGRDTGPLANPAHYFIMFGLFGVFASGVLAIVLPVGQRPGPAAVRITRDDGGDHGARPPQRPRTMSGKQCYSTQYHSRPPARV